MDNLLKQDLRSQMQFEARARLATKMYAYTLREQTSEATKKSADCVGPTKFKMQEGQYAFPYHHLVRFESFENARVLSWGIEYYGYMKTVLEIIRSLEWRSLLDLGCGDGKMIYELAPEKVGRRLLGFDLSEKAILFAKAFNYGNGAEFSISSGTDITETFDVISVIETLEHISDEETPQVITTIKRLLRHGGHLVVSVPAATIPVHTKHYRHYTINLLKKTLSDFECTRVIYRIKAGWPYHFLVRLSAKLPTIRLVRQLVLFLAERFLFPANEATGRHIISVWQKRQTL